MRRASVSSEHRGIQRGQKRKYCTQKVRRDGKLASLSQDSRPKLWVLEPSQAHVLRKCMMEIASSAASLSQRLVHRHQANCKALLRGRSG